MGRLEALTCPVQQHPGPIPGLGQFLRRTLDLCSRTRSVWRAPAPRVPQTSPSCEPRTALHKHSTASSGSSPSPHLRASTSALFSKHGTATDMHSSHTGGAAGTSRSEAIPPSARGLGVVLLQARPLGVQRWVPVFSAVDRRFSCLASSENGLSSATTVPLPPQGPVRGGDGDGSGPVAVPRTEPEHPRVPLAVLQDGGHAHPLCLGSGGLVGPNADGEALGERQNTARFPPSSPGYSPREI